MKNSRQIRGLFARGGKHRSVEGTETVVHILHARCRRSLVIRSNLSAGELNVADLPLVAISKYGHQPGLAASEESPLHGPIIAWQVGISIQDQELLPQHGKSVSHGSGGPAEIRPVRRIGNAETEAASIAGEFLNHLSEISHAHYDAVYPRAAHQTKLVRDKRLTIDRDQGLGYGLGRGTKPRGQTAAEDGDRKHGNQERATTRVPSKSNPTRISRRPASVIARRRRVFSSA